VVISKRPAEGPITGVAVVTAAGELGATVLAVAAAVAAGGLGSGATVPGVQAPSQTRPAHRPAAKYRCRINPKWP
jgi:hypothetical protein